MREWNVWLSRHSFLCKRVVFIPNGAYNILYESEWNEIKSTIEDML